MMLEIQVLAWYRHKNVAELNQLMGSQLLDNCTPKVIQIEKNNLKNLHRFDSTKMNDNINIDSIITRSILYVWLLW